MNFMECFLCDSCDYTHFLPAKREVKQSIWPRPIFPLKHFLFDHVQPLENSIGQVTIQIFNKSFSRQLSTCEIYRV